MTGRRCSGGGARRRTRGRSRWPPMVNSAEAAAAAAAMHSSPQRAQRQRGAVQLTGRPRSLLCSLFCPVWCVVWCGVVESDSENRALLGMSARLRGHVTALTAFRCSPRPKNQAKRVAFEGRRAAAGPLEELFPAPQQPAARALCVCLPAFVVVAPRLPPSAALVSWPARSGHFTTPASADAPISSRSLSSEAASSRIIRSYYDDDDGAARASSNQRTPSYVQAHLLPAAWLKWLASV